MKNQQLSGVSFQGVPDNTKIIAIAAFINELSNRAIFIEKVYEKSDFIQSILGTEKTASLLPTGFDKWFIALALEDQVKVVEALVANLGDQAPQFSSALALVIAYLVIQDTTLQAWASEFQKYYADLYYLDAEYLDYITRVFQSTDEGDSFGFKHNLKIVNQLAAEQACQKYSSQ